MTPLQRSLTSDWPSLSYGDWAETATTLHLWTQIVGQIRLVQTPWTNHSWHVPLYLTARGLTTSPIPCNARLFELTFDFLDHQLVIQVSDGGRRLVALEPRSVADFPAAVFSALHSLGLDIHIHTTPCEIADAIPFEQDTEHHHYDPEAAQRFWRARFVGKCSPVHFFWEFRSGGDPFLRPSGAAPSRRHPQLPRLGGAGGLFP
jgi:hypothetical protein